MLSRRSLLKLLSTIPLVGYALPSSPETMTSTEAPAFYHPLGKFPVYPYTKHQVQFTIRPSTVYPGQLGVGETTNRQVIFSCSTETSKALSSVIDLEADGVLRVITRTLYKPYTGATNFCLPLEDISITPSKYNGVVAHQWSIVGHPTSSPGPMQILELEEVAQP